MSTIKIAVFSYRCHNNNTDDNYCYCHPVLTQTSQVWKGELMNLAIYLVKSCRRSPDIANGQRVHNSLTAFKLE